MSIFLRALLLVIGFVLIIDCTLLIAADIINFGSIVPFFIGLIFLVHAVFWQKIHSVLSQNSFLRTIWKALWLAFIAWLISFVAFGIYLQSQIKHSELSYQKVEAIMILGGGVQDGVPTPTLANRLDTAVPLIKQQPNAIVITTGGVSLNEPRSEGEVMAQYLHALHGIELDTIYQEKKSTSTEENFLLSQKILADQGISLADPIAIVTSDFHLPRSKAIAEHQGYTNLITIASPTPLSIRYNMWFREYFAYVSGWLLGEY